jgi:hypothetical protein
MRTWVRIAAGLVLVVVILSVPRGEVEIHKRKCQAAWNSHQGTSITARIKRLYGKVTGTRLKSYQWEDHERMSSSQEALIELGYLTREQFIFKNPPTEVEKAFYKERPQSAFVRVEWYWNNSVTIIAPRSEMLAVSNTVRKIDERNP